MDFDKTVLKGGSLNSTVLYDNGASRFVRKSISTESDREYGYVRWYSQLKKLQRFDSLFPGLVPQVIDCGYNADGAYFDIEFIPGKDIKTLFVNEEIADVRLLNDTLLAAFDRIHAQTYKSNESSLGLYFIEEVEQKLKDAKKFAEFEKFFEQDSFLYNGKYVRGLKNRFDSFKKLFEVKITSESYVHGNPTLENIMYDTSTNKITFIDLYEEGVVDSKFMDYSQILQCSNSNYGIKNDSNIKVRGNEVFSDEIVPHKLREFNSIFKNSLSTRYTESEIFLIELFEVTQFFRMLPFKCHSGNVDAAKYFYVHACDLVNSLI